ncbi:hypothetical protein Aph01nite_50720 [Acrocarpospora phusangensis]|uniref:Uncharacterized protein n=1 Tax=Acrocarpospora phusangensis TaxID=1070424 RepID=A0A919UQE5_9ACTN|nr:hypothetical protein Aph01nite_50720 [Acrocarpospora phusangensis]
MIAAATAGLVSSEGPATVDGSGVFSAFTGSVAGVTGWATDSAAGVPTAAAAGGVKGCAVGSATA